MHSTSLANRTTTSPDPRLVRDVLIEAARPRTDDDVLQVMVQGVSDQRLFEAARRHQVVSLLHERLRCIDGVSPRLIGALARHRLAAQAHRLHLRHTQSVVAEALDVPWLLIKGESLARCYRDPSVREYNDLDLVIRPADFGRALGLLTSVGVSMIGENWQGYRDYEVAEIPLQLETSWIDLHWHVVALGADRRWINLPTEVLFDRAVPVTADRCDILTLDPADMLLHLCINVGLGGGRRLRGLVDLDAVLTGVQIDLDEFARRARTAKVAALTATLLQRVSSLLGTPVPHELLCSLSSRPWLTLNRLVTRGPRLNGGSAETIAPGLLIAASRDNVSATARALAHALGRSAAARSGRPGLTDSGGALDWQRRPDDGTADWHKRSYLDWVAAYGRQ